METTLPAPDAILQTAFAFWNSKVLLTAVTFDLFSTRGQHRLTGGEIAGNLACILAASPIFSMRWWQ